jgi:pimeloyl-ACP methyl ester carboxylesterase
MDVAGLLQLLAAGLVLFILFLTAWTAWTLTHPPRRSYAWAVSRGFPGDPMELLGAIPGRAVGRCSFESWTFTSRGRTLSVWEIAGDDPVGPLAILTHGWGDSRIASLQRVPALLPVTSRVVLWDLPGHGEAPGSCALGTREVDDLVALIDTAARRSPMTVVLLGFSLGAGVSIAAAARATSAVGAVIAEAPYRVPIVPARNVLALHRLPRATTLRLAMLLLGLRFDRSAAWMCGGSRAFDRAAHARRLACPLVVLHPALDQVCPLSDGRAIAAAAPSGELVVIEGAGHTNLWTDPAFAQSCTGAIHEFLGRLPRLRQRAGGVHGSDEPATCMPTCLPSRRDIPGSQGAQ